MSQPAVIVQAVDGALGSLPANNELFPLVVMGPCDGTLAINTPTGYGRLKALQAEVTGGAAYEAAAQHLLKGRPIIFVRTAQSVLGAYLDAVEAEDGAIGAITKTGTGTCVFTDNASDPTVGADVVVLFNVGGTRGTAGIVYQISLDGGQTWGAPQALGTATSFAVGATGASIAVSAGTVVAGDFISFELTAPVPASAGELVTTGFGSSPLGTATPSIDEATHPNDDYEVFIEFVAGGTRGTAGITYRWSLDGGRTKSPITALGTATSIIIPGSGGVKVDFAAGTIIAGATIAFPTVAPRWNNTELGDALTALRASVSRWELAEIVGPIDGDAFDLLEQRFAAMYTAGKPKAWIGNTRMPVGDETEGNYKTSLDGVFASRAGTYGMLCAGACKLTSAVSGRKYRRPISHAVASFEASVTQEINTADIDLGSLPGVSISTANGNPDEHDESVNPGLDDSRFTVLRTHEDVQGVYINRPRIFSADGSDFYLLPHRRVFNLATIALRVYFVRRLNKPILVDEETGYILEEEALEIEAGATRAMESVLLAKPKASAVSFSLSRTDNLLSTKTLTGDARVVPLAYPETISITLGFENPALRVITQAAA
jgi:hypothetical protein